MKTLLLTLFILLSGCGAVTVSHQHGELPDVDIMAGSSVCNKKFKAKVRDDSFLVTCTMKI